MEIVRRAKSQEMKRVFIIISPFLLILLFIISCLKPRVEITREYVSNSDWGKSDNSMNKADVSISRIKLTDTILNIYDDDFKLENINYIYDSTFCFALYYTANWKIKKVYFDREQKDILWLNECSTDFKHTTKVIGKLDINNWYIFGSVRHNYVYFVYVDFNGDTHVFEAYTALNW